MRFERILPSLSCWCLLPLGYEDMEPLDGLEPPTCRVRNGCSGQVSYRGMDLGTVSPMTGNELISDLGLLTLLSLVTHKTIPDLVVQLITYLRAESSHHGVDCTVHVLTLRTEVTAHPVAVSTAIGAVS